MADTLTIHADHNHEYHVRAIVAGHEVDLLVDTGFTNNECVVGVSLDEGSYRAVESRLHNSERVSACSLDPLPRMMDSGTGVVALVGLDGSGVDTRILNAGENLLGVCYFHHLPEFSVFWDLAGQVMVISRTGAPDRT